MTVYLAVAPPDGFSRWGDAEWDRWLREHPWEPAERIASRSDWATFLYHLRQHSDSGRKQLEPLLELLVNERPLTAEQALDLRSALAAARGELSRTPAAVLLDGARATSFASVEDVELLIKAARSRAGKEPSVADVWSGVFDQIGKVLESAAAHERGVYFGEV
jgi:hypothetical protein